MDEITKKNAIIRAMTEIECYPIIQEDVAIQEYTKVPLGQLSALGATFASIAPALKNVINNAESSGLEEKLYRMIDPLNGKGRVTSVGNIYQKGTKGIAARARYVEASPSAVGAIAQIDPAVMLMAIAISAVTKKLDQL